MSYNYNSMINNKYLERSMKTLTVSKKKAVKKPVSKKKTVSKKK